MTGDEVKRLLSFVSAACPQQRMDAQTPAAWGVLLAGVGYDDAYRAAVVVGRRAHFINPADIMAEVRSTRSNRLPRVGEAGACPVHPGQWAHGCGPCRSELIGRMDD